MSELIERIRLVLSPYRNFNHNIAVVDELIELIDEESAKEQQECEWNYDGDGYYLHGNDWISGKSDFKFCPYCGKVIKVSE